MILIKLCNKIAHIIKDDQKIDHILQYCWCLNIDNKYNDQDLLHSFHISYEPSMVPNNLLESMPPPPNKNSVEGGYQKAHWATKLPNISDFLNHKSYKDSIHTSYIEWTCLAPYNPFISLGLLVIFIMWGWLLNSTLVTI